MPTITITTNYDGMARSKDGAYSKYDKDWGMYVGALLDVKEDTTYYDYLYHSFPRFSLADLPSNANVTKVRVKVYVQEAGGAAHLTDIHPYNGNGQADPEADGAQDCFNRSAAGTPYVNDATDLRTTGEKWFTLGDGESAQACIDVENAKSAVNRFSLGFHEEGDDDPPAYLDALERYGGVPPVLEITYEVPAVPGYHYSDGLVSVQV